MLTPRQLIAETAKFFKLYPSRWTRNSLVRGAPNPVDAPETACFCTVGYMVHRLGRERPDLASALRNDPYNTVSAFLGFNSQKLVTDNDTSDEVDELTNKLINRAQNVPA